MGKDTITLAYVVHTNGVERLCGITLNSENKELFLGGLDKKLLIMHPASIEISIGCFKLGENVLKDLSATKARYVEYERVEMDYNKKE